MVEGRNKNRHGLRLLAKDKSWSKTNGIAEGMVPGGGIEPPTRGFSIHCSTPELPGHGSRRAMPSSGCGVLCGGGGLVQTDFAHFSPQAEILRKNGGVPRDCHVFSGDWQADVAVRSGLASQSTRAKSDTLAALRRSGPDCVPHGRILDPSGRKGALE